MKCPYGFRYIRATGIKKNIESWLQWPIITVRCRRRRRPHVTTGIRRRYHACNIADDVITGCTAAGCQRNRCQDSGGGASRVAWSEVGRTTTRCIHQGVPVALARVTPSTRHHYGPLEQVRSTTRMYTRRRRTRLSRRRPRLAAVCRSVSMPSLSALRCRYTRRPDNSFPLVVRYAVISRNSTGPVSS